MRSSLTGSGRFSTAGSGRFSAAARPNVEFDTPTGEDDINLGQNGSTEPPTVSDTDSDAAAAKTAAAEKAIKMMKRRPMKRKNTLERAAMFMCVFHRHAY